MEGVAACHSAPLLLFGFNLQAHTFFFSYLKSTISEAVRVARCLCGVVSGRCRGIMRTVIQHPRCSAPLICVLSAFREPAPMFVGWPQAHCVNWRKAQRPDTKREQTGRQVSGRSHKERRDICCSGFHATSTQRTVFYCSKYSAYEEVV